MLNGVYEIQFSLAFSNIIHLQQPYMLPLSRPLNVQNTKPAGFTEIKIYAKKSIHFVKI